MGAEKNMLNNTLQCMQRKKFEGDVHNYLLLKERFLHQNPVQASPIPIRATYPAHLIFSILPKYLF
jgi:hypothetical protein